jgi:hypothetical protein
VVPENITASGSRSPRDAKSRRDLDDLAHVRARSAIRANDRKRPL